MARRVRLVLLALALGVVECNIGKATGATPRAHGLSRESSRTSSKQVVEDVTPESDLSLGEEKRILVVTTAAVPWLTGTAINPLLRAAHLALTRSDGAVTLMLPWCDEATQRRLKFPETFATRAEHAAFVLKWVVETAHLPEAAGKLRVAWYDAHYHHVQGSIYPMGETLELLEDQSTFERFGLGGSVVVDEELWRPDVVVLEEPEHLNWYAYRDGDRSAWRQFPHVVGVAHTNYVRYAGTERAFDGLIGEIVQPVVGPLKALAALSFAKWMCAAHCHRVIKLSATLPRLTRRDAEVVSNVHGVRDRFLEIGDSARAPKLLPSPSEKTGGAYFIGKMLWPKGLDRLLDLLAATRDTFGGSLPHGAISLVGDGSHKKQIEAAFKRRGVEARFLGRHDHADAVCQDNYRVLVNPSVTEVLCTTVAEALAMGKWVVIARHPSNSFFYQFPTCLPFSNAEEFARAYSHALRHEPPPLASSLRHVLTWEAATRRFCKAAAVPLKDAPAVRAPQRVAAYLHTRLGKGPFGDLTRSIAGAGIHVGPQWLYVRRKSRRADTTNAADDDDDRRPEAPVEEETADDVNNETKAPPPPPPPAASSSSSVLLDEDTEDSDADSLPIS